MVQKVMSFLDETPNMEVKLSVIETLRTVTEGKVGLQLRIGERSHVANKDDRFSLRSRELELRVSCPTLRRLKAI